MKRSIAITPTITTADVEEFRKDLDRIATFAEGVHIDFAEGHFAPSELLSIEKAWRSVELITHAHIMYQRPLAVIDDIIHLEADMVILHAESEDVQECLEVLQENGTRTGIALLAETSVAELKELSIDHLFDHVLVFGGKLGFQGGEADLTILKKVKKLREEYPDVELGWDGGVNHETAKKIVDAGVTVLNVGGFIKKADDPKNAYDSLVSLLS